jgi:hypothetical protein
MKIKYYLFNVFLKLETKLRKPGGTLYKDKSSPCTFELEKLK